MQAPIGAVARYFMFDPAEEKTAIILSHASSQYYRMDNGDLVRHSEIRAYRIAPSTVSQRVEVGDYISFEWGNNGNQTRNAIVRGLEPGGFRVEMSGGLERKIEAVKITRIIEKNIGSQLPNGWRKVRAARAKVKVDDNV
jgi:hypothetical protein